jgi:hypothetical protein
MQIIDEYTRRPSYETVDNDLAGTVAIGWLT